MREITHIVIHCSSTPAIMDIGREQIREWHLERGWLDIGYHWVVRRSGVLEMGRDLDGDGYVMEEVGAHVSGHNQHSLSVCWVGGYAGIDNRTDAQKTTMASLVMLLKEVFPKAKILGHRDFPGVAKLCPSFEVSSWLTELKKNHER